MRYLSNFFFFPWLVASSILLRVSVLQAQKTAEDPMVRMDIEFLASDELAGRLPGHRGHEVAARYIATQYSAFGLQMPPDQDSYFQEIPFEQRFPALKGSIRFKKDIIEQGSSLVFLQGAAMSENLEAVYLGQGWIDVTTGQDDFAGTDIAGQVVVVDMGAPGINSPGEIFEASRQKRAWVTERGGKALIELYNMGIPFGYVQRSLSQPQMSLSDQEGDEAGSQLAHAWLTAEGAPWLSRLQTGKPVSLNISLSGVHISEVIAPNVVGIIPGQDPVLSQEYILLSAHFDHVGAGQTASGRPYIGSDSIYNGARDNAFGAAALLHAARVLSLNPPKRSVIVAAFTAEEMGLLGSKFYADHPLIPLNQTVYNLNADGAGYDDTSTAMLIGWGRSTAQAALEAADDSLSIRLIEDQLPQMNLFSRSDQLSLAQKGVPGGMLSPTIRNFNEAIQANYHSVTDGAEAIDFGYATQYASLFAQMAWHLGNMPNRPQWTAGDPFEETGKALYKD